MHCSFYFWNMLWISLRLMGFLFIIKNKFDGFFIFYWKSKGKKIKLMGFLILTYCLKESHLKNLYLTWNYELKKICINWSANILKGKCDSSNTSSVFIMFKVPCVFLIYEINKLRINCCVVLLKHIKSLCLRHTFLMHLWQHLMFWF